MPAGGGARACIADMPGPEPARALPRVPRYAVAATRVLPVCGEGPVGRPRMCRSLGKTVHKNSRENVLTSAPHLPSAPSGYRVRHHAAEAQVEALPERADGPGGDGKFIIDQRYRPRSGKEVRVSTSSAFDTRTDAMADWAKWRLYVENGFASGGAVVKTVVKRRRGVAGTGPSGGIPSSRVVRATAPA